MLDLSKAYDGGHDYGGKYLSDQSGERDGAMENADSSHLECQPF
jgi:hypothetical protein